MPYKQATKVDDNQYIFEDGNILKREYGTISPNGNVINGLWVFRDKNGNYITHNQYINDIESQYGLRLHTC